MTKQDTGTPFTGEQSALIHEWMNDARTQGADDAVMHIIGAAAAFYFERNEPTDSEAALLCDRIYSALRAAEEDEA